MSGADIRLKHDGWVVVADGEKALFLRNNGDEKFANLDVFREEEHENPPNREWKANRAGRLSDAGSNHKSKVEDTDWHQLEKERFASDLADILYKQAHKGKYSDLIIVAAPQILGEIRKNLHKEVQERIVGEVDKDLTNHPVHEIEDLVVHSED